MHNPFSPLRDGMSQLSRAGPRGRDGGAKKFFEKSRRKRLTARRGRDKFPLLRRGEILAARSEKNFGVRKKVVDKLDRAG